jgi:hypothetical protein
MRRNDVALDDPDYFQKRAEAELELAQAAKHAAAVRAHYLMAGYYLDRVHNKDAQGNEPVEAESAALRRASAASQRHGEIASDYIANRIEASRTAGDAEGARLWERVLELVDQPPPARPRNA